MAKPKKSKRFQYSLETLLKVRGIREKQQQDKFDEADKTLKKEVQKEDEIKETQQRQYDDLRSNLEAGKLIKDLQTIMMREAHLEVLKERVEEQVKVRKDAEEKKEEERKDLVKAVKEKKVIEINKEKKRWEWKKFMDKEEGKFLDDISTVSYVRKRRK